MGWERTDPAPHTVTTVPAVAIERCRGPVRYRIANGSMNVPARLISVPSHNHQYGAGRPSTRLWNAARARDGARGGAAVAASVSCTPPAKHQAPSRCDAFCVALARYTGPVH